MARKRTTTVRTTTGRGKQFRKGAGRTDGTPPLTEGQHAMIWTMLEEGLSRRAIAAELGVAVSTVMRTLAKDPIRLEDLRTAQRESRAQKWKKIEDLGLDETIGWLERSKDIRTGKRKPKLTDAQLPSFLNATRRTAETATKSTELLTGGATERHATESTSELTDSAEAIISQAIELGVVDRLPARLREEALRRMQASAE